jgi:serine/threonine protein kinase
MGGDYTVCSVSEAGTAAEVAPVFPMVEAAAYALGPELARGGMGRIRIATDLRVGRKVAIKELIAHTPALALRFVREARLAAQLQHPNIVPIYEVGCWPDGTPFYAMRHVDGKTLARAITTARTLEDRLQLLPSMIAAVDAVAFAHASGVVHRDLTPSNILLGAFGETVVIDWGLAKDLVATSERVASVRAATRERPAVRYRTGNTHQIKTGTGIVVGTPMYMPPEQAAGKNVDARADVYALGAILYHLISGRPPYFADTARKTLELVRAEPPLPLAQLAPDAPAALVAIIERAMARAPGDRYADAGELVHALRAFQAAVFTEVKRAHELVRTIVARMRLTLVMLLVLFAGG